MELFFTDPVHIIKKQEKQLVQVQANSNFGTLDSSCYSTTKNISTLGFYCLNFRFVCCLNFENNSGPAFSATLALF